MRMSIRDNEKATGGLLVLRCWDTMLSLFRRIYWKLAGLLGGVGSEVVDIGGLTVRVGKKVAEGGFAFVHVASDASDRSRLFALKKIVCHEKESLDNADAEMDLISRLPPHPNIVRFRACTRRPKDRGNGLQATEVLLLTDFYEGGGLHDAMERLQDEGRSLDEACLLTLFAQACSAVAHLHAQTPPIAHRDIKMENLVLSHGDFGQIASGHARLVLCDFGSATTRAKVYETRREILDEEERIQKTTTLAYRAPEMVDLYQRKCINEKVDVWALGVLLYVTAFFKFPFDPLAPLAILSGKYTVPAEQSGGGATGLGAASSSNARTGAAPTALPAQQYSSKVTCLLAACMTVDPDTRSTVYHIIDMLRTPLPATAATPLPATGRSVASVFPGRPHSADNRGGLGGLGGLASHGPERTSVLGSRGEGVAGGSVGTIDLDHGGVDSWARFDQIV